MRMEPPAHALQELCRGMEINLGASDSGVPQISREQRELGREVVTVTIPCQKAVYCK